MLNRLEREQLLRRWEAIEQELVSLAEVRSGPMDPAERERRLIEAREVIECLFAWDCAERQEHSPIAEPKAKSDLAGPFENEVDISAADDPVQSTVEPGFTPA